MRMSLTNLSQMFSLRAGRGRLRAISLFCVLLPVLLAGCASMPPFKEKAQGLVGLGEKELLACSGLPNASFTTQDGTQVLVYSMRRAEIQDYGFTSNLNYWGHWGRCSPFAGGFNRCAPYGFGNDIEIKERSCQVGYWIKDGKVTHIMGENSFGGLGLCSQILNRCLQPDTPIGEGVDEAGDDAVSLQKTAHTPSY